MKILALAALSVFISCSHLPKLKTREELARTIFELLKKRDKKALSQYLITRSELRTVFGRNEQFAVLSKEDQSKAVDQIFETQQRDVMRFIDFYTDDKYPHAKALKEGEYNTTDYTEYNENGIMINRLSTRFISDGKLYYLITKSVNIDANWKLISWIEVKEVP